MLSLHNRKRASRGLPRLCVHPKLQKAARAHSVDMIRRDYFSHNTKGRNEGPCQRLRRYPLPPAPLRRDYRLGLGQKRLP